MKKLLMLLIAATFVTGCATMPMSGQTAKHKCLCPPACACVEKGSMACCDGICKCGKKGEACQCCQPASGKCGACVQ